MGCVADSFECRAGQMVSVRTVICTPDPMLPEWLLAHFKEAINDWNVNPRLLNYLGYKSWYGYGKLAISFVLWSYGSLGGKQNTSKPNFLALP